MKITALDFETANYSDVSICAAGIAVFDAGELVETRNWRVRPPTGHGRFREDFIAIHGIRHEDVADAPEFPLVAAELLPFLTETDVVVAHNAPFDLGKLRGTLGHFGILCPQFICLCSCRLSRRAWPNLPNYKLNTVAVHIGHTFNHHNASADAEAAGRVLCAIERERGEKWVMGRIAPLPG